MKDELKKNLLNYIEKYLNGLNDESVQQASDRIVNVVRELKEREELKELASSGLIKSPVVGIEAGSQRPAPEEQKRMDVIKEKRKITADELADEMKTNRNLESVYLNKLLRKGLVGRWREGKYTLFLLIEDAIKITVEEMKKDKPDIDLMSEDTVLRICNRIGARDIAIVRHLLMGL